MHTSDIGRVPVCESNKDLALHAGAMMLLQKSILSTLLRNFPYSIKRRRSKEHELRSHLSSLPPSTSVCSPFSLDYIAFLSSLPRRRRRRKAALCVVRHDTTVKMQLFFCFVVSPLVKTPGQQKERERKREIQSTM